MSIYKAVGYGIIIPAGEYENTVSDHFLSEEFYNSDQTLEDYAKWTLTRPEKNDPFVSLDRHQIKSDALEGVSPHEAIAVIDNPADKSVILLIFPPGNIDKWDRLGDAIDMVEYQVHNNDSTSVQVNTLNRGIFPYSDLWVNKKTGEKIPHDLAVYLPVIHNTVEADVTEYTDKIVQQFFPKLNSVELLENITPDIPPNIRLFAEWVDVFKDNNSINLLSPMYVSSWG